MQMPVAARMGQSAGILEGAAEDMYKMKESYTWYLALEKEGW
jgi:hypothetical protein